MQYAYEAMTDDGRVITDHIEADSRNDVAESLRGKGMTVLQLNEQHQGAARLRKPALRMGGAARSGDLVLFTRQLKMLLEAGSALVPALQAIEAQTSKPAFVRVIRQVREHVEEGGTLAEAFGEHPRLFRPVFCAMVSAGEATATLPDTFDRLNTIAVRGAQTRKMLVGALAYPALLSVLCVAVAVVVLGFVVPRFSKLFENLNTPLPPVTKLMFQISEIGVTYWPVGLGFAAAVITGIIIALRTERVRRQIDNQLLKLPIIGRLARRLVFARILRIWAAMLRCHVPLLETIHHSKAVTSNAVFVGLTSEVEEAISGGGSIGRTLAESGLVEPVIASAVQTGEENGRLSEAVDFVSAWIDDDNSQAVAALSRIVEPLMLAVMGLFVGLVAMSLFIPLFDLATAGAR